MEGGLLHEFLDTVLGLLVVVFLVGANAFFVATEFALVSIRHSRVEELMRQGVGAARVVNRAIRDLDRYIAGTQVGITLASIGLGWVGEPAVASLLAGPLGSLGLGETAVHAVAFTVAFGIITFLHVVFGELIPKSVALQRTESTALRVSRPMALAMLLFRPLIWALNGTGNAILRAIGLEPAGGHHAVHSAEELKILVRQSHEAGVLDDLERRMVERTFRFSDRTTSEVMVPRADVVAIDLAEPSPKILDRIAASTHTRFPVYEGTIDNIVGIVHVQDIVRQLLVNAGTIEIRPLLRPPLIVPDAVHLDALLEQFRQHKTQMAVVVDEHGGTAGLVTLEDVVEEVFGDVQDALDATPPAVQAHDGRIVVRGDARLDEVNERVGWSLDDPDADTVGGYVMKRLGRMARTGDTIDTDDGVIRVESVARHRITQVALGPRPSRRAS